RQGAPRQGRRQADPASGRGRGAEPRARRRTSGGVERSHPRRLRRVRHRSAHPPRLPRPDPDSQAHLLERPHGRVRDAAVRPGNPCRRRSAHRGRQARRHAGRGRRGLGRGRGRARGQAEPRLDRWRCVARVPGGEAPPRGRRPGGRVRRLLFAANWKMHLGPDDARAYLKTFRARYNRHEGREVWFFPPAVSLEATAQAARERTDLLVGAQDLYWEPKGAFTGAISAQLAFQAGARATLVGHSERRHVFGETDEDTRRKVAAAVTAGLVPMLCVGETLAERDAGHTLAVVVRQLAGALSSLDGPTLSRLIVAYEPVWAIGTGRN